MIDTTVGKVEILYEDRTGIVSVYRFNAAGRPIAAAFENWQFSDLAEVLERQTGVPATEAQEIAAGLAEYWSIDRSRPDVDEAAAEVVSRPPASIFSFVLMGLATLALLIIIWTTLQAFI